jgi:DNA repair exonuclease SbcCD nuclease subunit
MSKALIFSDLHLHSHKESVGRLNDCLKVLDWIFNEASKHNVEHILFLGDLFHERSKIDVLNYLRTFETFMRHMLENDPKYHCWLLFPYRKGQSLHLTLFYSYP